MVKLKGKKETKAWSLIRNKKTIVLFEKTAMRLRSQRPLHVQGVSRSSRLKGGGKEKKSRKKWKAEEIKARDKGDNGAI
jgi:hypothetical protein